MKFAVSDKKERRVAMKSSRPSDDELDDEIKELEAKHGRGALAQPEDEPEEEDNYEEEPVYQEEPQEEEKSKGKPSGDMIPKEQYDSLRSNRDKKINELNKRLKDLEQKLDEKDSPQPPATGEELEEWLNTYPQTAKMLETWLINRLGGTNGQIKELKSKLDQINQQTERQRAAGETIAKIAKKHPDWAEVRDDPRWIEWRDKQEDADRIKTEVEDASFLVRTITAFKHDVGWKRRGPKPNTPPSAPRGTNDTPRSDNKARIWYASDIEKMTDAEFDKYEDDIMAARKEGRFRPGRRPPSM